MAIDSRKVRQLFENLNRTAGGDFLWREVAARLHDRLSVMTLDVDRLVDVGCGRGDDLPLLCARFPRASAVGVDAVFAPLHQSVCQHDGKAIDRLCGDAALPLFQPASFNLVWSNMMLHWAEDIGGVLSEWYQMLQQDGLLLFSCLGYGSLQNLYHAFAGIDGYDHVMTYPDFQQLGNALVQTGFPAPVIEHEWIDLTYQDIGALLRDIRALGGNPLGNRRQGLMGKGTFARILQNLEHLRDADGRITLRFEIIFAHAFKESLPKKEIPLDAERPVAFYR